MIPDQFWLTAARFSKIASHPPTDMRGKARVDDRRVISGIVHVLKSEGALDRRAAKIRTQEVSWCLFTIATSVWRPRPSGSSCPIRSRTLACRHRSASGGEGGEKIRPADARAADARATSTR